MDLPKASEQRLSAKQKYIEEMDSYVENLIKEHVACRERIKLRFNAESFLQNLDSFKSNFFNYSKMKRLTIFSNWYNESKLVKTLCEKGYFVLRYTTKQCKCGMTEDCIFCSNRKEFFGFLSDHKQWLDYVVINS